jgi:peptidoglycan/LPS O-acetylase OafA/YrhL
LRRRLIELDFIRGIAILAVMAYHYVEAPELPAGLRWIAVPTGAGWAGVDLFFVLSGYLVGGLLFSEYTKTNDIRFGRFLFRRALKIWPSYYFYLLFQVIVRRHPLSTFLVQNLSNLQNYLGSSLEHTWSLAVEEHFYLVLAAIFIIWRRYRLATEWILATCCTLCVAILALRICLVLLGHRAGIVAYTHTRLDSMLFGVILAWISFFNQPLFQRLLRSKYTLTACAAIAVVFALSIPKSSPIMLTVGFTVLYLGAAALILLASAQSSTIEASRPARAIAWIGLYSYTIYLWHLSVREPIHKAVLRVHLATVSWWLSPILETGAAIVIAMIASRLVEWPMLKIRDRLMPERQIAAVAAEVAH